MDRLDQRLNALAARYADLGQAWSELASAAMPDSVPSFRKTRELFEHKAEVANSGGSTEELRAAYADLDELRRQIGADFPLTEAECTELRAHLQTRVRSLYEREMGARDELGKILV